MHYDINNASLRNLRQSILEKSQSRGKSSFLHHGLQSFKHDPDLSAPATPLRAFAEGQEDLSKTLQAPLPELSHGWSAPPKAAGKKMEAIPEAKDDDGPETEHRLLQLKLHEEIFLHTLSILALIPAKREEMLGMLNTYSQRHSSLQGAQQTPAGLDLVSMAQKRLLSAKTVVDIPDDAKLLLANSKMLELYAILRKSEVGGIHGMGVGSQQQHASTSHSRYIDLVHDEAEAMRAQF